jgi:hypothetical protein
LKTTSAPDETASDALLPEIPARLNGSGIKPLQWKPPAAEQLSPAGKTRLESLCQQYPKIEETWWLLNGRRTAGEICARSSLPAEAILDYLDLLLAEDKVRSLPASGESRDE